MIKDSRFFFSVELRVEDIEKNRRGEDVTWPMSDLTNMSLQLRGLHVNSLMTDDLPQQWRSKASRQLADQGQRESRGLGNGGAQEAQEALEVHAVGGWAELPAIPLKVEIRMQDVDRAMHGTTMACRRDLRTSWDLWFVS